MLFIEKCLPLSYHSKYVVVQDYLDDRHVVSRSCCYLVQIHSEASVTGYVDDCLIRSAVLCSDSCANTVTHGSKSA